MFDYGNIWFTFILSQSFLAFKRKKKEMQLDSTQLIPLSILTKILRYSLPLFVFRKKKKKDF